MKPVYKFNMLSAIGYQQSAFSDQLKTYKVHSAALPSGKPPMFAKKIRWNEIRVVYTNRFVG